MLKLSFVCCLHLLLTIWISNVSGEDLFSIRRYHRLKCRKEQSEKNTCLSDDHSRTWKVQDIEYRDYQEGWPDACFGERQSPIELLSKTAEIVYLSPLAYTNYDVPQEAYIENTGNTVRITLENKSVTISGGILEDEYVLDNIHFHWNSEHTFDGRRYPLESHFVHYLKRAGDLTNAVNLPNGVAVIAVFYEFSPMDSKIFENISKRVKSIAINVRQPVLSDSLFVPKELLPREAWHYYTYPGSLTTPDCNETVQWIVFTQPLQLSKDQLAAIKDIYGEDNRPIVENARPLQALNGRIVKHVKETVSCKSI